MILRRLEVWFAIACAVPALLTPMFPGLDMPWHTMFVAAIHQGDDAGRWSSGFLEVDFRLATYASIYAVADALSALMSPIRAMQVIVAGYVVAWVLACSSLLAAYGRDRRVAVLLAPLAYSLVSAYGFIAFAAALPLVLWSWAMLRRYLVSGSRRALAGAVTLALCVAVTHSFAAALAGIGACVIAALGVSRRRAAIAAGAVLLSAVPTILMVVGMGANDSSSLPDFIRNASSWERLTAQPQSGVLESLADVPTAVLAFVPAWMAAAFLVGAIGLLIVARRGTSSEAEPGPQRRLASARGPLWLAGLFSLGYLMTPYSLSWPRTMVAAQPRWVPLLMVLVAVAAAPRTLSRRWLVIAMLLALVPLTTTATSMARFGAEARDLLSVARAAAPGATTLALIEQSPTTDRRPAEPMRHAGAYLVARKGGIVSNVPGWAKTQPWVPVALARRLPTGPPPGHARRFRPAKHGEWDQYLIRDSDPSEPHDYFGPSLAVEELARAGRWRLYRRSKSASPGP